MDDGRPKRNNHGQVPHNTDRVMRACSYHPAGSPPIDDTDFALREADAGELSVYAMSLTDPIDLKILVGPNVEYIGIVTVEQVLSQSLPGAMPHLGITFTTSYHPSDSTNIDNRKGAVGHCSIFGLNLPERIPGKSSFRQERKDIRRQLAEAAIRNGTVKI